MSQYMIKPIPEIKDDEAKNNQNNKSFKEVRKQLCEEEEE